MVGMSSAAAAFDVQPRCDTAVIATLDATLPSAIRNWEAVPPFLAKALADIPASLILATSVSVPERDL